MGWETYLILYYFLGMINDMSDLHILYDQDRLCIFFKGKNSSTPSLHYSNVDNIVHKWWTSFSINFKQSRRKKDIIFKGKLH